LKAKVVKRFRDKYTKKIYAPGSVFEGNEKRVAELQKLGYLKSEPQKQAHHEESKEKSLLDGAAQEVIEVLDGLSKDELEGLLAEEKEGKKRKTVIEHIESLLA